MGDVIYDNLRGESFFETIQNTSGISFALGSFFLEIVGTVVVKSIIDRKRLVKGQHKRQFENKVSNEVMLSTIFQSQENDRRRISKKLHDEVGMMLMTMRLSLSEPGVQSESLLRLVDETHETIKCISWNLMPQTLERFGLSQTIIELCKRFSRSSPVSVSFKENGNRVSLSDSHEISIYRIVEEGVNNALNHGQPRAVEIRLDWTSSDLFIEIQDDGVGFDFANVKSGHARRHGSGLLNIESRIGLFGGTLDYRKNNPTGTILSSGNTNREVMKSIDICIVDDHNLFRKAMVRLVGGF